MTQPIKVLVLAAFIAFVIKSLEREEKSALEELFVRYVNNEILAASPSKEVDDEEEEEEEKDLEMITKPPSARKLEKQRQKRLVELRMHQEMRGVVLMLVFTALVYYIGLSLHDVRAFRQTQNIRELLKVTLRPMPKAMYQIQSVDAFLKVCE